MSTMTTVVVPFAMMKAEKAPSQPTVRHPQLRTRKERLAKQYQRLPIVDEPIDGEHALLVWAVGDGETRVLGPNNRRPVCFCLEGVEMTHKSVQCKMGGYLSEAVVL